MIKSQTHTGNSKFDAGKCGEDAKPIEYQFTSECFNGAVTLLHRSIPFAPTSIPRCLLATVVAMRVVMRQFFR
jgi:hypothetical protein